jgi:hypothetical protein
VQASLTVWQAYVMLATPLQLQVAPQSALGTTLGEQYPQLPQSESVRQLPPDRQAFATRSVPLPRQKHTPPAQSVSVRQSS